MFPNVRCSGANTEYDRGRLFCQTALYLWNRNVLSVWDCVWILINSLHDRTNPGRVLKRGQWYPTLLRPHFVPSLTIPSPILSPPFSCTALCEVKPHLTTCFGITWKYDPREIKQFFFCQSLVLMVSFPKTGKGIEQKASNGSLNMDLLKQRNF